MDKYKFVLTTNDYEITVYVSDYNDIPYLLEKITEDYVFRGKTFYLSSLRYDGLETAITENVCMVGNTKRWE